MPQVRAAPILRLIDTCSIPLSALFVLWFASGIVMMYAGGMPRLTPELRLERLAALVGVEDRWLRRLHTALDRDQVQEAAVQRNVRHVGAPALVRTFDRSVAS